tara:strand:- start:400 stop:630 length:231 start_codon:yes stop_codon:yes gene_type:complete
LRLFYRVCGHALGNGSELVIAGFAGTQVCGCKLSCGCESAARSLAPAMDGLNGVIPVGSAAAADFSTPDYQVKATA